MNTAKDMSKRSSHEMQRTKEAEMALRPAMDICEDDTGITLQADMPGVDKSHLEIKVEGDSLMIEGDMEIPVAKDMDALYADVRTTHYRRGFTLSRELDPDHIDANLKDGVLTLRIPKREEHQPRKIEVRVS